MSLPFASMTFPEIYEAILVRPLFRPWAEGIVRELAPAPGERFLDVACGTGIVARLAGERLGASGRVVGVDLSPAMLGVARKVAPDIDWREGDGSALPLGEAELFDVLACQQGLQFFADREAGVRSMRRALVSGGRLAVSCWRPDDEFPLLRELRQRVERHVGPIVDRRHAFGDSGSLEGLLRGAGFRNVRSKKVAHTVRFADGGVFVRLNAMALVGMSAAAKDLEEAGRGALVERIASESLDLVARETDAEGLAFELAANVARGTA